MIVGTPPNDVMRSSLDDLHRDVGIEPTDGINTSLAPSA